MEQTNGKWIVEVFNSKGIYLYTSRYSSREAAMRGGAVIRKTGKRTNTKPLVDTEETTRS